VAVAALRPDVQLEAVSAFCRRNLGDPGLSPQMVAGRFGISVCTLRLCFQKLGESFGSWVLKSRLGCCRKALRDPRRTTCSISQIVYCWGFNHLSHFDKAFRARFGMAPRQWRGAAHV
jgi:AraC-like DNA-binding protein